MHLKQPTLISRTVRPVFAVRFGLFLDICSYLGDIWFWLPIIVEGNEATPEGHQSAGFQQPEGIVNHLSNLT